VLGKKFAIYDLEIRLKWEGELKEGNKRGEGSIIISEFTQQSDSQYEVSLSLFNQQKEIFSLFCLSSNRFDSI
jgi:hypothetical protein